MSRKEQSGKEEKTECAAPEASSQACWRQAHARVGAPIDKRAAPRWGSGGVDGVAGIRRSEAMHCDNGASPIESSRRFANKVPCFIDSA